MALWRRRLEEDVRAALTGSPPCGASPAKRQPDRSKENKLALLCNNKLQVMFQRDTIEKYNKHKGKQGRPNN